VVRLHLPALRRASIRMCHAANGGLRLDRDSFCGVTQLEALTFDMYHHQGITLLPDCLAGLPSLATVELARCNLASIPAALTALSGSLRSLSLPWNYALKLTSVDVKTVLALRELRYLDLQKGSFRDDDDVLSHRAADAVISELGCEPALWTTRSVQHLCELRSSFLAQHSRELNLELDEEGYTDEEYEDESVDDSDPDD